MSHRTVRHRVAGAAIIAAVTAMTAIGAGAGTADAAPKDDCATLRATYKVVLRNLDTAHARKDFESVKFWRSTAFDLGLEIYGKC